MANDRLWLTCGKCGVKLLLLKYWIMRLDIWASEPELHQFFTLHLLDCYQLPSLLTDQEAGPLFRLEPE